MEVYFIVNEFAGNGRGKKIWEQLERKLAFSFTVYKTAYAKHAISIVDGLKVNRHQPCLVIGIGGDGTINEIVSGAAGHKNLIVSAFKAGSGNDFARGYRVFHSASEINNYVKQEQLQSTINDLGEVQSGQNKANFVNNTGFGFDALVATTVNRSKVKKTLNKLGLGRLAYILLTIKLLFSFKKFTAQAVIDGQQYTFKQTWFIAICNQPYFGGGMKISPRSKMNDKQLEVVVVQHLSPIKLLLLFLSVFTGKHETLKDISFINAKTISLCFDDEVVSHVDGDLFENVEIGKEVTINIAEQQWSIAK